MEDSLPKYIDFQDSFIAFIDVLGIKDRVRSIETREEFTKVAKLLYGIKIISSKLPSSIASLSGFQTTAVSDSLIVTVPSSCPNCCMSLILILHQLQYMFLHDFQVLVRGYIARGLVYHQDGILFGSGYIDACEGERSIGPAPRIVIDSSIVETGQAEIKCTGRDHYKGGTIIDLMVEDSCDGSYFIDYLKPIGARASATKDELIKEHATIKQHVTARLQQFKGDRGIYPKYRWLNTYLERSSLSI